MYLIRQPSSSLRHKVLAVVFSHCLASALHRFHVIAVNAEVLVLVGWLPRVSPGILNAEDDNRQDESGQHGGDDESVGHCVVPLCVVCCMSPIVYSYRQGTTPTVRNSRIISKLTVNSRKSLLSKELRRAAAARERKSLSDKYLRRLLVNNAPKIAKRYIAGWLTHMKPTRLA